MIVLQTIDENKLVDNSFFPVFFCRKYFTTALLRFAFIKRVVRFSWATKKRRRFENPTIFPVVLKSHTEQRQCMPWISIISMIDYYQYNVRCTNFCTRFAVWGFVSFCRIRVKCKRENTWKKMPKKLTNIHFAAAKKIQWNWRSRLYVSHITLTS